MVNIGVLGAGNIAHRVAKGILCSEKANFYAVASRSIEKAENFQQKYSAQKAYGSYEEFLKDPQLDVVYICTPNEFHYKQIEMCLSFGKHVVCEKPMVANEEEVKALFAKARENQCFLMEAEKTMFTPLNRKLKEMIAGGIIGNLQAIRAEYSYEVLSEVERDHWVLGKNMGGCSYDIGVYPISFSHFFADAKIKTCQTQLMEHPEFACDFGMQADVVYDNGVYGFLQSNWFYTPEHKGSAILAGTEGYIEVPAFWKGTKAYLHKNGTVEEISVEMESDFEGEVSHAAECIEKGLLESPILGEEMSVEIIKVFSKLHESVFR